MAKLMVKVRTLAVVVVIAFKNRSKTGPSSLLSTDTDADMRSCLSYQIILSIIKI